MCFCDIFVYSTQKRNDHLILHINYYVTFPNRTVNREWDKYKQIILFWFILLVNLYGKTYRGRYYFCLSLLKIYKQW